MMKQCGDEGEVGKADEQAGPEPSWHVKLEHPISAWW